jgi:hypothetical protein
MIAQWLVISVATLFALTHWGMGNDDVAPFSALVAVTVFFVWGIGHAARRMGFTGRDNVVWLQVFVAVAFGWLACDTGLLVHVGKGEVAVLVDRFGNNRCDIPGPVTRVKPPWTKARVIPHQAAGIVQERFQVPNAAGVGPAPEARIEFAWLLPFRQEATSNLVTFAKTEAPDLPYTLRSIVGLELRMALRVDGWCETASQRATMASNVAWYAQGMMERNAIPGRLVITRFVTTTTTTMGPPPS